MYTKIFASIFDGTLGERWEYWTVMVALCALADANDEVDITHEALARRTSLPIEVVRMGIAKLEEPDARTRTQGHDGRRIIRIDENRDWGWKIVNRSKYKGIRDQATRREYFREYKREQRARGQGGQLVDTGGPTTDIRQEKATDVSVDTPVACTLQTNQKGVVFQVTEKMVDDWQRLYQNVNVIGEVRKMAGWLQANQKKRKTLSGMPRFVVSWLAREQDKGPRREVVTKGGTEADREYLENLKGGS